ncbi:major tail protein [Gordonia phage Howe]|uniref:Major tail protein n=1 Tax=Gordonia phage Howe TaxID=1777061 RepID=A0A0U4AZ38_9CAUD|nr:major tail protein [Gordonia phage Howe]AZF93202.1 major tail protein [Gordonia phage Adora]QDF16795.1 major tail protein [Gordonia phage Twinkle]QYC54413.1 major tail protein [Gordonia phage Shlim410]UAJ16263.1 major tail protein [Gordonia phage Hortense]ALY07646.1 major tail protein [Gordonia phage Howe]
MTAPTPPLKATNTADLSVATSGQVRVEIDTAAPGSPAEWTEIKGIQQWGPKFEQNTEDDTDVSTGGWASEFPVGNAFTVSVSGLVKGEEDPTFVVDPGVQALLDHSETYGKAGVAHLRYQRTDGIPEAYEFYSTVKVSKGDDKPPALQKWSGDLTGKGQPTKISKWTTPDETP